MAVRFFEKFPEVLALMSIKNDGNLRVLKDEAGNILPNYRRRLFLEHWMVEEKNLVSAVLEHGNVVRTVDNYTENYVVCDGLTTTMRGKFLSVTGADCPPFYFYEPRRRAIGICHGGRKGLVSRIIPNTINSMLDLGAERQHIMVVKGPHIYGGCYELDLTDLHDLGEWGDKKYLVRVDPQRKKIYWDMGLVAKDQLEREEIKKVYSIDECTHCRSDKYFSARREKKNPPDAMMAVIGMP